MDIVSNYEIAIANLVVAMKGGVVTAELREKLTEAIGDDIELEMDALNAVIVCNLSKAYEGEVTFDKAMKTVKAEYKSLGFNKLLSYEFLEKPITLFFQMKQLGEMKPDDGLNAIKEIYAKNKNCPVEPVKDAIDALVLRLLSHYGAVTEDISFTQEVMSTINGFTEERKNAAVLPSVLVTEM